MTKKRIRTHSIKPSGKHSRNSAKLAAPGFAARWRAKAMAISVEDLLLLVVGVLMLIIIITVAHYLTSPTDNLPMSAITSTSPALYFDMFIGQTAFKYIYFILVPLLVVWIAKLLQRKAWNYPKAAIWCVIGVAIMLGLWFAAPRVDGVRNIPDAERPIVQLFVMSFCPFGQKAEAAYAPVYSAVEESASFEPHFIFNDLSYLNKTRSGCILNDTLCSLHGNGELYENIRQICIWKHQPERWWGYALCINANCTKDTVQTCWTGCAAQTGVDVEQVQSCQEGEGIALAVQDRDLAEKVGVVSSPTLLINGEKYAGTDRTEEGYLQAVCAGFTQEPELCDRDWKETKTMLKATGTVLIAKTDMAKCTEEGVCPITEEKSVPGR